MTVEIALSGIHAAGRVALIDDDMEEFVRQNSWAATPPRNGRSYVFRGLTLAERHAAGKGPGTLMLHRAVLGVAHGSRVDVDHINRDTLDNRRANLRIVTRSQNMANSPARTAQGEYKGVQRCRTTAPRWVASITVNWEPIYLGTYDCPEVAAAAYNRAALQHFGQCALLNTLPAAPGADWYELIESARKGQPRGDGTSHAKLRSADIPCIRAALASGEGPCSIGRRYGVGESTIRGIKNGRSWKHIPQESTP